MQAIHELAGKLAKKYGPDYAVSVEANDFILVRTTFTPEETAIGFALTRKAIDDGRAEQQAEENMARLSYLREYGKWPNTSEEMMRLWSGG